MLLDGGVTTNIPSRPDLNQTNFETTRVWNTFLRGDHQLNAANTWGLRWLRETSPQPRQIQAENHTPARFEAETDIDWTLVGNLSSVIGNAKVNTFRVSAVKEDVFFGNPNFNTNGHNQKILLPRLDYLNFEDQQSARANRRLDVAYGGDDVFSWFVPNKGGEHELKFGINYLYSTLRTEDYGTMNGIFTLNTDLPFDRNNPRTYPERLHDARAWRGQLPDAGAFHRHVRAGQMEDSQQADAQSGRPLRRGNPADAKRRQSVVRQRPRRVSEGSEQRLAAPWVLLGAR